MTASRAWNPALSPVSPRPPGRGNEASLACHELAAHRQCPHGARTTPVRSTCLPPCPVVGALPGLDDQRPLDCHSPVQGWQYGAAEGQS